MLVKVCCILFLPQNTKSKMDATDSNHNESELRSSVSSPLGDEEENHDITTLDER